MAGCMRRLLLASLALCFAASTAAAAALDTITQRGSIRIGYVAGQSPFSAGKPGADPEGYAMDLCDRIADDVEHHVPELTRDYIEVTLADGFEAVKNGKIDLLCGAITVNLDRREIVDFSQPIFVTGATALLRTDSPAYLRPLFIETPAARTVSADAASTSTIGVRANTTTRATLHEAQAFQGSSMKIADFATHDDGLAALENRGIDAYFADRALLVELAKRARDPSSLEVGDRLFTHEPYAVALPRNDSDFRLLADRALTNFFRSDDFMPTLTAYFGAEAPMLYTQIMMEHIP